MKKRTTGQPHKKRKRRTLDERIADLQAELERRWRARWADRELASRRMA